ncbi:MAG: anti-sigma factor [Armatimonadota bacterium]
MDCRRVDERIDAWLDGELSEREQREIARHLDQCGRCTAQYGALVAAVRRLEALADAAAAPEDYMAAVMARLPARQPSASPARIAWLLGLSGALGTAASVLVAAWLLALLPAAWGGLTALGGALLGPAISAAHGALVLGEALAGPVAWGLAANIAIVGALGLAHLWRGRLGQSAVCVAA